MLMNSALCVDKRLLMQFSISGNCKKNTEPKVRICPLLFLTFRRLSIAFHEKLFIGRKLEVEGWIVTFVQGMYNNTK